MEAIKVTANNESTYWASNPEWYHVNKEKDEFELTEKAPERAIKSFDMWKNPEKYGIRR